MCAVMQHYEAIAEARGEARGRDLALVEFMSNMLNSGISFEAAAKLANIPEDKVAEYRRKFNIL